MIFISSKRAYATSSKPYLSPFGHNTSVTDEQTGDNHDKGPTFKLTA